MPKRLLPPAFALCALVGCGEPGQPPPPPPAVPAAAVAKAATPVAAVQLAEFQSFARQAAAEARLPERQIRALPVMHRLQRLERALVRFTHGCYEEDDFAPDDVFQREGYMVLLGRHRGVLVGLTTRCAVDVRQPGYQYLDPHEPGDPEFVAGVLTLHAPGGGPRRDHYLIDHETDWNHPLLHRPYGRFTAELLAPAQLTNDTWPAVLERGARVVVRPIGTNDLALVAFEPRPRFGATLATAGDTVVVTDVWPGSVAARAGCRVGDRLVAVGDTDLHTPADLVRAVAALEPGRPFSLALEREGPDGLLRRTPTAVFRRGTDFIADGTIDTLGVEAPMNAIADLLEALATVGDLLQTDLTAQCARCRERIQRAEVRGTPGLAEALGRLIPIAGGLLSLDADSALDAAGRVTGVGAVVDSVQEWRRLLDGVDDLQGFLQAFPLGDPVPLDPASARALSGDRVVAVDHLGARHEFRLAYCAAAPGGRRAFQDILDMAAREHRLLVAVPDGRDLRGTRHVHLVVMKPEQWPVRSWSDRAELVLDGYVNLVLVRQGACTAQDHGASDGRSTRLILEALRRADALK